MIENIAGSSIQICIAFTFVWAICAALPKLSASVKCWLWRLVLLKGLVSLTWVVSLPVLPHHEQQAVTVIQSVQPNPGPASASTVQDPPMAQAMDHTLEVETVAIAVWLVVLAAALLRLTHHAIQSRQLARRAQPVTSGTPIVYLGRVSRTLGLRRLPRLAQDAAVSSPLVTGVVKPTVVMSPASLQNEDQIAAALGHELSHVRRLDLLWDLVTALIRAVFWFHPLAWIAGSRARIEAEIACDAVAMEATGASPQAYASMLVNVAAGRTRRVPALCLPLDSHDSLEKRLIAMKTETPNHRTLRKLVLAILLPSALVLVPMRLVKADPPAQPEAPAAKTQANGFDLYRTSGFFLFADPAVKNDLRLTDAQVAAIHESSKQSNAEIRALGDKLAQFSKDKVSNKVRYEYDSKERPAVYGRSVKRVLDILTPEQRARLVQIALQYNGPWMLSDPALATKAGVSDSTRKAIAALYADYREISKQRSIKASSDRIARYYVTIRELTPAEQRTRAGLMKQYYTAEGVKRDEVWAKITEIDRRSRKPKVLKGDDWRRIDPGYKAQYEKERAKDRELKKQLNSRILKLLTPAQKAKWTEMQGKKITFTPSEQWAEYVWSNGRYVKVK